MTATVCVCGCERSRHRSAMRWGVAVRAGCKDCGCDRFGAAGADVAPAPPAAPVRAIDVDQVAAEPAPQPGEVLGRYAAYLCRSCGSRYGQPYDDHEHGPLTPVTVLIVAAQRPGGAL